MITLQYLIHMNENILPDLKNYGYIYNFRIHYFVLLIFSTNSDVLIPFV